MKHWSKQQLIELVNQYGSPLFVYDTAIMQKRLQQLKAAFPFSNEVYFSCKSSDNPVILSYFQHLGCGLDTVSLNQVKIGLEAGFSPSKILYTPNGSCFSSYVEAYELGVQLNFDNVEHLERFVQLYPNAELFVRFNPGIIAGGSANVSVGHVESKFGIHLSQLSHLLKIVSNYNVKIIGIHVHAGSDIIDTNQFIESAQALFDLTKHFPHLQNVNIGSGFRVAYKESDSATDIQLLGAKLQETLKNISQQQNKKITLIVEPGKFLVSDAGVFLTKVNLVKQTPSATFVFVNAGFNHLLRPMYYNAFHTIENITSTSKQTKIYNVVGYLGETDTFGWNRALQKVEEEDILLFYNAGAYGYSMASNYNSRTRPAEILLHENTPYLIRKPEELSHLLKLVNPNEIQFS